jgi:soluble lytic murein transglycosylase-like protein
VRISKVAILVGIIVIWAVSAGSSMAQGPSSPAPINPPVTSPVAKTAVTGDSKKATALTPSATPVKNKDVTKPETAYKESLNSLSTLYQNEVQRLEQKNQQAKDLYKDGLISRVEMEANEKALADARAKVDDIAKQIAESNKPMPSGVGDGPDASGLAGNQFWSTGNNRIDSLIRFYGNQYSVDPYLIYCLMSQESKFLSSATSPKGAQGLMQLMPGTAARYGVTNPYDIAQSIQGGTRYLKDLLKMFNGRVDLALAGYNAGENAVIKYGYTVPPYDETRNYVKLIIKRYGATAVKQPRT